MNKKKQRGKDKEKDKEGEKGAGAMDTSGRESHWGFLCCSSCGQTTISQSNHPHHSVSIKHIIFIKLHKWKSITVASGLTYTTYYQLNINALKSIMQPYAKQDTKQFK